MTDYLTTKETKIDEFKKLLRLDDNFKWLTRIISPLDPGLLLADLLIEKATIFSSKKCPVMLTWNTGALLFKVNYGLSSMSFRLKFGVFFELLHANDDLLATVGPNFDLRLIAN